MVRQRERPGENDALDRMLDYVAPLAQHLEWGLQAQPAAVLSSGRNREQLVVDRLQLLRINRVLSSSATHNQREVAQAIDLAGNSLRELVNQQHGCL